MNRIFPVLIAALSSLPAFAADSGDPSYPFKPMPEISDTACAARLAAGAEKNREFMRRNRFTQIHEKINAFVASPEGRGLVASLEVPSRRRGASEMISATIATMVNVRSWVPRTYEVRVSLPRSGEPRITLTAENTTGQAQSEGAGTWRIDRPLAVMTDERAQEQATNFQPSAWFKLSPVRNLAQAAHRTDPAWQACYQRQLAQRIPPPAIIQAHKPRAFDEPRALEIKPPLGWHVERYSKQLND